MHKLSQKPLPFVLALMLTATGGVLNGKPALGAAKPAPTAAKATPKQDLHAMEIKYLENALNAKKSYTGSAVKFVVYVTKTDEKKGKPLLQTNIVYYSDGMQVYCDVWLSPRSLKTALSLKPGDCVEVSGTLRKREVLSKDEVQYHGSISRVYNGSGGGGTVNGGTVTRSWSVYTIDNASVKVVETVAAKAKMEAAAANRRTQIINLWTAAVGKLDVALAKQALDKGLEPHYVDAVMSEIASRDPSVQIYGSLVEFYDWCLHQKGVNAGVALADVFKFKRPKLLQKIVDGGGINYNFVFKNGDNVLHYLIKDQLSIYRPEASTKSLAYSFSDSDAEIIEILCSAAGAKGLGDRQDQFGMTPKEYVKKWHPSEKFGSVPDKGQPFQRIREAITSLD